MIKELTANADSIWGILSTCLCFGIFLGVVIYLLTDRRRQHHRRMEALPLDDGTKPHA